MISYALVDKYSARQSARKAIDGVEAERKRMLDEYADTCVRNNAWLRSIPVVGRLVRAVSREDVIADETRADLIRTYGWTKVRLCKQVVLLTMAAYEGQVILSAEHLEAIEMVDLEACLKS